MILAGDIGGTKTHLALFSTEGQLLYDLLYPSQKYRALEPIIEDFFKQSRQKIGSQTITTASFAIAGPVIDGVCKTTNLPWAVDAQALARTFTLTSVFLLNDLEANAYALEILSPEGLLQLEAGSSVRSVKGNRAVVSPGTGLGEAGLFFDGKKYTPFATEGGHCDFAPRGKLQIALYEYLESKFGHVSYERVLSGPGFLNLYKFLCEHMHREEPSWLKEEMQQKDPAQVITQHGLNRTALICVETLDLFVTILGAEVSNCILKFMATGGIYLGGGIPPKILPKLQAPAFFEGLIAKGRFETLVKSIPIYVILDDRAALKGAFHYGCLQTPI